MARWIRTICFAASASRDERNAWQVSENQWEVADLVEQDEVAGRDWVDIQDVLQGNGHSYARLVRRYQIEISTYMWRFTRDQTTWEELVQDVFVEAYLSLASYSRRAPFANWLKRIATRVGYRYWKQRRRRNSELPLRDIEHGQWLAGCCESDQAAEDAAELVHYLLGQLGPRDRLVMTLTYLEECDVKEVARLTGWKQTMVRVQLHRARRRLAKICSERGIEL